MATRIFTVYVFPAGSRNGSAHEGFPGKSSYGILVRESRGRRILASGDQAVIDFQFFTR
jgi:hypothetical protein